MNTNNFTASQKGDGSSFTENSTKYAADSSYDGLAELVRRLEDLFRHFPADLLAAVEPAGDRGDAHAKLLCNVFQVCHGMHRLSPDIIT